MKNSVLPIQSWDSQNLNQNGISLNAWSAYYSLMESRVKHSRSADSTEPAILTILRILYKTAQKQWCRHNRRTRHFLDLYVHWSAANGIWLNFMLLPEPIYDTLLGADRKYRSYGCLEISRVHLPCCNRNRNSTFCNRNRDGYSRSFHYKHYPYGRRKCIRPDGE